VENTKGENTKVENTKGEKYKKVENIKSGKVESFL
jgi:hypothetical protein